MILHNNKNNNGGHSNLVSGSYLICSGYFLWRLCCFTITSSASALLGLRDKFGFLK